MRIRTRLSIVILVGAFVAIPLYVTLRSDRNAESPSGSPAEPPAGDSTPAAPPAVDDAATDLYCARRTPSDGIIVHTGPECARHGQSSESSGPHAPTVTITREPGALVITGSDP